MLTFFRILTISLTVAGMAFVFCSKNKKREYPKLTRGRIVLEGDPGKWDENFVHTLSVVSADRDGYKYWGYYGLDYYNGPAEKRKAGLVWSNDLIHWEKYTGNPIIESNCRWPSVILADGIFYLYYEEYDSNKDSRILRVSSRDGIHFSQKEEVVPFETGLQNQNPFIYYHPADESYCLFYYHGRERGPGEHSWNIYMKKAKSLEQLNQAPHQVILSSHDIIASPSIVRCDHRYFLTVESFRQGRFDNKWVTRAYESQAVDGAFIETKNSPILRDNDACAFQAVYNNELFIFYSQRYDPDKNNWDLRMVRGE